MVPNQMSQKNVANTHDGSMYGILMLTKLGYIDGKCGSIYGIHTDPSWDMKRCQILSKVQTM